MDPKTDVMAQILRLIFQFDSMLFSNIVPLRAFNMCDRNKFCSRKNNFLSLSSVLVCDFSQ
jgi:hypothetical protein